jgi:sugar (pentulose or hexulose) kinase
LLSSDLQQGTDAVAALAGGISPGDFKSPATRYKPAIRWWWQAPLTNDEALREMQSIADAGFGEVEIAFSSGAWATDDQRTILGNALEAVCYRLAAVLEALGSVETVVATGHALLASPDWTQILADVLGRPVEVSAVAEGSARGAAVMALERLGLDVPEAPIERMVEPRLERHEIHRRARHELDMRMETK